MGSHLGYFMVFLTLFALGAIIFSFMGSSPANLVQDTSRLTGYPAWHPVIKGYNADQNDGSLMAAILLITVSSYLGLRWTSNPPTSRKLAAHFYSSDDSAPVPTIYFDRLMIIYSSVTMTTLLAVIIFDIGKVFATIGVFHNASEFVVLIMIGSGGKITNNSFWGYLASYVVLVTFGSIALDWPYDAVFFKFQGLCFDYALVITFIRILAKTHHELKYGSPDLLTNINNEDDEIEPPIVEHSWLPNITTYPNHIWLLVIGSISHIAGNLFAAAVFDRQSSSLFSTLTYAITFPTYVYYVYLDLHARSIYPQKRIYLPDNASWKIAVVTISSICFSLLTIRFGVYMTSKAEDGGDYTLDY